MANAKTIPNENLIVLLLCMFSIHCFLMSELIDEIDESDDSSSISDTLTGNYYDERMICTVSISILFVAFYLIPKYWF